MSEFLYLFSGEERAGSPSEMQQHMQRWAVWVKELAEKGHVKAPGRPLERAGKLVQSRQKAVVDGPFAEAKDVIGGYLLVEAEDLAHAVELAKGCPVLERGGTVEVRPVMKMSM
ncbi:MAG TPA: YciI family protein [Sorangium sp.]|nr:YciI family protein [Sorangium sp.]